MFQFRVIYSHSNFSGLMGAKVVKFVKECGKYYFKFLLCFREHMVLSNYPK